MIEFCFSKRKNRFGGMEGEQFISGGSFANYLLSAVATAIPRFLKAMILQHFLKSETYFGKILTDQNIVNFVKGSRQISSKHFKFLCFT